MQIRLFHPATFFTSPPTQLHFRFLHQRPAPIPVNSNFHETYSAKTDRSPPKLASFVEKISAVHFTFYRILQPRQARGRIVEPQVLRNSLHHRNARPPINQSLQPSPEARNVCNERLRGGAWGYVGNASPRPFSQTARGKIAVSIHHRVPRSVRGEI